MPLSKPRSLKFLGIIPFTWVMESTLRAVIIHRIESLCWAFQTRLLEKLCSILVPGMVISRLKLSVEVLATDHYCWGEWGRDGDWATQKGFNFARRVLQSKVEDLKVDVLSLSPETVGVFDLVLFLGVLYHMRHPLLALEKVASVTGDHLILETHVDLLECERPAMAFYPGKELNNDISNWCGPNPSMIEAMLKDVGFSRVKLHAGPYSPSPVTTRVVYHAWK